ncbi:UDP-4-amino-4,6-dideoxy-N-acetyl-beta-L-altrosamine transaminase [Thalassospira lucentensis]|uniref:UDP-4-amino-4, 6-dideoxy-N-acetyl-beta-L-altrosamine transaminase n=1 Tax=Thalassospira lucentensis TaxID=168935 RepID=UPI00399D6FD9
MIPYGRQDITDDDIRAVTEVLRSDFLTQGPAVPQFETLVAKYCHAEYAVAVNSATSALHLACIALELGPGDWLWTVPVTFVASANCALYCGAEVDFVDIDPHTYTMSVPALTKKLDRARKEGRLPKVVLPVHLCGQSADMAAIHALSQEYGFKIIEDASHAIGGRYKGQPIGNCSFSDIAVFSFHPVKIITTGEGGVAVTNNAALARKMKLLRSHGITREPELMTHEADGPWYYQQIDLGFNYRMTDLHAALGGSQMVRIDDYVTRRHELAECYNSALSGLGITLPWQEPDSYSAYHLYVIRIQPDRNSVSHVEVFNALRARGIGVNLHYIPVHTQPYYQNMGFKIGDFPEAERYYSEAISLPLFPALTSEEQWVVIDELRRIFV